MTGWTRSETVKCARLYFPKERLHIALADLDFSWRATQVEKVCRWWADGRSVCQMGKWLRRDPDEVALLVMDLARRGKIERRPRGAWGREV